MPPNAVPQPSTKWPSTKRPSTTRASIKRASIKRAATKRLAILGFPPIWLPVGLTIAAAGFWVFSRMFTPAALVHPAADPPVVSSAAPAAELIPPAPTPVPDLAPAPPEFSIRTATEQDILDHQPAAPVTTIFRLDVNPRILVLDFSSLREQGLMLNRIAAFVEKAGMPRDRIMSDAELDAAIRGNGESADTFYYGHDYGAASLARVFSLADRDEIRLTPQEEWLRRLSRQEGWFAPDRPGEFQAGGQAGFQGGLLSIPQAGSSKNIDKAAREVILRHELSHGEYFTNPDYAAFTHSFWTQVLTSQERERIRGHLRSLGYDSNIEEIMENESQAYLMFTDSPEFFTPAMIGMTKARLATLRAGFRRAMPLGWLRDGLERRSNDQKATTRR